MDIGIVFGEFSPLHQGHMDLVMRSKKVNDITFVCICGYDGDERAEAIGLPLRKRWRIIHNFLADELVKVIMINDTELGIDESMSESNWDIWVDEVYSQIKSQLNPIELSTAYFTWYVGEKDYGEQLNKRVGIDDIVLLDRTQNAVSGTLCRKYPLQYWNKITSPFRAYMSHNILIAGTASEGKTTLVKDIGKYFSIPYSYEKGRDICSLKTDPEFTVKDFIYNIYEQHSYNESLITSPQNPGIFISDTDSMVSLMYAKAYKDRDNFDLDKDDYDTLVKLADAYNSTTKWDKIFLLAPKAKNIVDDGERYMPDSNYEIRKRFFDNLTALYDERNMKYEILTGNYLWNFNRVRDYIKSLYEVGK